uniref:Leucine rich repeat protein 1 n=1 Tax=Mandrillus leucophaeus TaxID=9568 RepID=A0A2K5XB11_MANLE
MKLQCEVEVISRHLPALGLRNRGKGVRAVLSLCQQTSRSQPSARAFLLISTLKDKRGTRYEVREVVRPWTDSCRFDSIWLSYHSIPSLPRFGYRKNLCLWKILSELFHSGNYYHESAFCCPHCGLSR